MDIGANLLWYNLLIIVGAYSVVLSVIARLLGFQRLQGVVYGIAIITSYFTRNYVYKFLPLFSHDICILLAFAGLILSNLIMCLGNSRGGVPSRSI